MSKLFKHQKQSIRFLSTQPVVFDMSDPGTGKTRVEIEDFVKRRVKGGAPALIIAPKSLLVAAWSEDFKKFAPDMKLSIATAKNRDAAFAVDADVYITNYDATKMLDKKPAAFWKKFKDGTLIIDESTAFKHHTTPRSKVAYRIAQYFTYRRLLSGTPNPNGVCDLWHQVKILDNGKRLGTSFFAFRSAVCTPIQVGPAQNMIKWVDKPEAEAAVSALIKDITIRHVFEDCTDIPENHKYSVPFILSKKHMMQYMELENCSILQLKDSSISAINGAVLYTKLLQCASGAAYNDDGTHSLIDTDRYDLVMDLVEARKHSIVFFNWTHQRDYLMLEADKRGLTFGLIDGSVNKKGERDNVIKAYQRGQYRVLFAHPQSAAHGLTLTRGTSTIFASPTYNLEHYVQGLKRIHRIGQTERTETIMVVAPGTVEERVYQSLQEKNFKLDSLLNYLKVS